MAKMPEFIVAVLLCSTFFVSNKASDECNFVINELNAGNPANIKNSDLEDFDDWPIEIYHSPFSNLNFK